MAGIVYKVRITGVRETLAAFNRLPDDANNELRDRSKALADTLAEKVRAAGIADSAQSAVVARSVKARRDRVPVITAGGSGKAGALVFGSEFGANGRFGWYSAPRFRRSAGRQFRPHQGAASYWFFRTIEGSEAEIDREWNAAADDIVRHWGEG